MTPEMKPLPFWRAFGAGFLLLISVGAASGQSSSYWRPTPLETMDLPRFCHGQFIPELRNEPGATIIGCGGGMNHFCPGLVLMNRAMKSTAPKAERRGMVSQVKQEFSYTQQRMTPNCPVAADFQAAQGRLRVLEMLLK